MSARNELIPLPCCAAVEPKHVCELVHLHQFDFDLYRCDRCSRHWVWAWRDSSGGWEAVTETDAGQMQALKGPELRTFMKTWAVEFN